MIIVNDENSLRIKCEDVLPEEVDFLINLLETELKESNRLGKFGIGLAAPQIGIYKNIAIVRIDQNYSVNLVNCKIENAYDPFLFKNEGCLSFPGRNEDTTRFQEIHVTNNLVYPHKFIATGLMAVVCQHEIGHLNGDLFFDHAIPKVVKLNKSNKVKPNDPCTCDKVDLITGKVKKYKKCCGRNNE